MWDSFLDGFGALLGFFYDIIPNYGVAIVLLTVAIRLLLFPLTSKQARSMAEMQRVQPEIKKIQQKYKHDRQKLNEELMAFYKEHKINPLAGCLPLLAQFPIFIALFQVLRSPASHIPDGTGLFRAFCPGVETEQACSDAADLPVGLEFLSMDLSRGANASHAGFVDALPFFLLIGLVVGTGYLQSRQMTRMQRGGQKSAQAQMMTKIFPVFFGVISYTLPAGVVLYFLVSNVWQIGQQQMIFGRSEDHSETVGKGSGKAAKVAPSKDPEPEAVEARSKETTAGDGDGDGSRESGAADDSGNSGKSSGSHQQRSKSRKRKKRKKRR